MALWVCVVLVAAAAVVPGAAVHKKIVGVRRDRSID